MEKVKSPRELKRNDSSKEKDKDKKLNKSRPPMVITGPTGVVHQGHVGFNTDQGRFEWHGLPESYQRLFTNLDKTLQAMGVNGLSQAEAKLLLKALPTLGPNPVSDTPLKSPSNLSADKLVKTNSTKDINISAPTAAGKVSKVNQGVLNPHVEAMKEIVGQQKKTIEELSRFKNDLVEENNELQKKIEELKSKQESVSKLKERLKALEKSESVNSKVGEQERNEMTKMKRKVEKYKKARTMVKDENEMLKLQLGAFSHIQQSLDAKQSRATIQVDEVYIKLKSEIEVLQMKYEKEIEKRRVIEKQKKEADVKIVELKTIQEQSAQEIADLKAKQEKSRGETKKLKSRLKALQKELEEATANAENSSDIDVSTPRQSSSTELTSGTSTESSEPEKPVIAPRAPSMGAVTQQQQQRASTMVPAPAPPPPPPGMPDSPGVKKVAPKAGLKKGPMPGGPKKAPVAPLPLSSDTGAADSRGGILDAIKNQEVNLKPVEDKLKEIGNGPVDVDDQNMLNLIAKALISRRKAFEDDSYNPAIAEGGHDADWD
jgi:hypothetical protein